MALVIFSLAVEDYQTVLSIDLDASLNARRFLSSHQVALHHRIVCKSPAIGFQKSMLLDYQECEFSQQVPTKDISILLSRFYPLLV